MTVSRRGLLKWAAGSGAGLALGEFGLDFREVRAATKRMKLSGAQEFTTVCNFCSCGCGMVVHVKDGKILNLEGDPDHIVNEGSLCPKGAAMKAAHESPERLTKPLFRASGSDRWTEISWDEALDKIAKKAKAVRDANWIAKDTVKDEHGLTFECEVNRTEAIGLLGGAQNTNEESYLFQKMGRLIGTPFIEHQARL